MAHLIELQNGTLVLPTEILEALGLKGNETLIAEVVDGRLVLRPLTASEAAKERLMAHLQLPAGALAHMVDQPQKPVTVEDELGGDIYGDID